MDNIQDIRAEKSNHLEALHARHSALSEQIENEQRAPSVSTERLRELKTQKLQLKDTIYNEERGQRAS